jgi:hypothetical protein
MLLAGCKIDARVEIAVHDNGSGTVTTTLTLDADAVRRLGDGDLSRAVPLDDLQAAGWEITPLSPVSGGGASATLTHDFVDEADLARRLQDLAGPNGILRDPKIARERETFRHKDGVSVVVDLRSPTLPVVDDQELAARLTAAGLDPAQLQAEMSRQLREALNLTVVVRLPGGAEKLLEAKDGEIETLAANRDGVEWDRITKLGIAVTLALLAGAFLLASTVSARRDRRRKTERRRRIEVERAPLM